MISRKSKLPSRTPQRQPTWEQIFQMVNSLFLQSGREFFIQAGIGDWEFFFVEDPNNEVPLTAHLALPIETVDPEKHQNE